jgi:limonene-1,2-epoxide hydrolase
MTANEIAALCTINGPMISRLRTFIGTLCMALGLALSAASAHAGHHAINEEAPVMDNKQIVTDFINAWSTLDAETLVEYFTEDGTYHNMMLPPVTGQDALRGFISNFLKGWIRTDWEILNIVADGNVVIVERIDRTSIGDKSVELPCTGVFIMEGGKIKIWRDYFDLATYRDALAE